MKAIVFSPEALYRLNNYTFAPEWFTQLGLPSDEQSIKRVELGDVVYFLDRNLLDDEGYFIVVNLEGEDAVFREGLPNLSILDRIITITKSIITNSVSIPHKWKPRHEDSVISVYAANRNVGRGERLHVDQNFQGSKRIYFFATTDGTEQFTAIRRHSAVYEQACSKLEDALLADFQEPEKATQAGIILTQRLPQGFTQGTSLKAWYENKLTQEQRAFVDKPHDGPTRLRGSAGTGKTLSLVVKFLHDAMIAHEQGRGCRYGFLTHSDASSEMVQAIVESLDPKGLIHGSDPNIQLEIRTIYDLAFENLRVKLDELEPISLDGRAGREMQLEIIESVLAKVAASEIFVRNRFAGLCQPILDGLDFVKMGEGSRFIRKLSNEFASVLDAEGIRAGQDKGEDYAKASINRPAWLMDLPNEVDRRFVLEIHRRYRETLHEMNTLSIDQMIGDFNQALGSNRWDHLRTRQGYDALYVDELHLFTSTEREVLHKLLKPKFDEEKRPMRPAIFMAYDLKQSPRDSFTHYGDASQSIFTSKNALQNSELVQLTKVFRYTPQIAEFLTDLDSTMPAIDIPGEWNAYSGEAELGDGPKPELQVYSEKVEMFQTVFRAATKVGRSLGGRRVAVLCASDDDFALFLRAASGQFSGKFIALEDRGTSEVLKHAGNRFVFSMPEYVAGLQFDTVYLISVNQSEAPSDTDLGQRRQFVSTIYLGSSRAEQRLYICSSISDGGPSEVLNFARDRGSLTEV